MYIAIDLTKKSKIVSNFPYITQGFRHMPKQAKCNSANLYNWSKYRLNNIFRPNSLTEYFQAEFSVRILTYTLHPLESSSISMKLSQ